LPTITHIGACGVEPSNCTGPTFEDIDGVNQWNTIIGERGSARSEFLVNYDQTDKNAAIRMGKWKLLQGFPGRGPWVPPPEINFKKYNEHMSHAGQDPWELEYGREKEISHWINHHYKDKIQLYDVESDPYEKQELSKENPKIVKMMLEKLQVHKSKAVQPGNKDSDPKGNPKYFGGVWTPWLQNC
jgi:arylsulfatase B/arylsulfatase I/J